MTASEAARLFGVHRTSIYYLIERGIIPARRSGRTWLVRVGDIDNWDFQGHRHRKLTEGDAVRMGDRDE